MNPERIRVRSTMEVLRALSRANPSAELTENLIRGVIRRGLIDRPATLGGAFMWKDSDVRALAGALVLELPVEPGE